MQTAQLNAIHNEFMDIESFKVHEKETRFKPMKNFSEETESIQ
jgi:hypothetical protein